MFCLPQVSRTCGKYSICVCIWTCHPNFKFSKRKKKKAKSTFQSFLWTASNFWIVGVGFGVKESDLCYQKEVQWFLWIFVRCVYWRKLVTVNRMTTFFILLWQFWDIFLNLQICNKVSFLKKRNPYALLHSRYQMNSLPGLLETSVTLLNMSFVRSKVEPPHPIIVL